MDNRIITPVFCVLACLLIFCPSETFTKKLEREFLPGLLGGSCAKSTDCEGPVEKVCLVGICNCGTGLDPFEVAGTLKVGCFGRTGITCVAGNIAVPAYFTNKTGWDEHYAKSKIDEANNKQVEDFKHHREALDRIHGAGMDGKSELHWSCQSGICTDNVCTDGDPHAALIPIMLPVLPPNDTDAGGNPKSLPVSYSVFICFTGLMIIFFGANCHFLENLL